MATWRTLGAVLFTLAASGPVLGHTYSLGEATQIGDCVRVRLELNLSGEIKVNKDGQTVALKREAVATHEFPERVLALASNRLPAKAARVYENARATLTLNGENSTRALRRERRLLVAQRYKDQPLVYCPAGSLTREELELTDHFDVLSVAGLL